MTLTSILKNISIFSALDEKDLTRLEKRIICRSYSKGQVLFHKDDDGGTLYIIKKGKAKVYIPSHEGEEVILALLSDGEIMGDLTLIDGSKRSATVELIEASEVYSLEQKDFIHILSENFEVVMCILAVMAKRLRDTNSLLKESHLLDARSRLARKIIMLANQFGVQEDGAIRIGVRITQKDLAAMIGATRESVNKNLQSLKKREIIQLASGDIMILDMERLSKLARLRNSVEFL